MNKKGMKAIPILVMLALMIGAYAPVAFATSFTLDWSGNGLVTGGFTATGTTTAFSTQGNGLLGSWDAAVGGQGYGIDYTTSDFDASFNNGAYVLYSEQRLATVGSVGYPGEGLLTTNSYVSSFGTGGTGSISQYVNTNYASLYSSPTGQFAATGDYYAYHNIAAGLNFGQWAAGTALVSNTGTMSITERIDSAGYYGSTDWTLGGPGTGSYGNAQATLTGSGTFRLDADSDNYLAGVIGTPYASAHPGWEMASGGSYTGIWAFDAGLIIPDFSLKGN